MTQAEKDMVRQLEYQRYEAQVRAEMAAYRPAFLRAADEEKAHE